MDFVAAVLLLHCGCTPALGDGPSSFGRKEGQPAELHDDDPGSAGAAAALGGVRTMFGVRRRPLWMEWERDWDEEGFEHGQALRQEARSSRGAGAAAAAKAAKRWWQEHSAPLECEAAAEEEEGHPQDEEEKGKGKGKAAPFECVATLGRVDGGRLGVAGALLSTLGRLSWCANLHGGAAGGGGHVAATAAASAAASVAVAWHTWPHNYSVNVWELLFEPATAASAGGQRASSGGGDGGDGDTPRASVCVDSIGTGLQYLHSGWHPFASVDSLERHYPSSTRPTRAWLGGLLRRFVRPRHGLVGARVASLMASAPGLAAAHASGRVLGVHVRGGDMAQDFNVRSEFTHNVPLRAFVAAARQQLAALVARTEKVHRRQQQQQQQLVQLPAPRIILASDSADTIALFEREFGADVVVHSTPRWHLRRSHSAGGADYAWHRQVYESAPGEALRKIVASGSDVLTDIWLLSKSDVLVSWDSAVARVALALNPAMLHVYLPGDDEVLLPCCTAARSRAPCTKPPPLDEGGTAGRRCRADGDAVRLTSWMAHALTLMREQAELFRLQLARRSGGSGGSGGNGGGGGGESGCATHADCNAGTLCARIDIARLSQLFEESEFEERPSPATMPLPRIAHSIAMLDRVRGVLAGAGKHSRGSSGGGGAGAGAAAATAVAATQALFQAFTQELPGPVHSWPLAGNFLGALARCVALTGGSADSCLLGAQLESEQAGAAGRASHSNWQSKVTTIAALLSPVQRCVPCTAFSMYPYVRAGVAGKRDGEYVAFQNAFPVGARCPVASCGTCCALSAKDRRPAAEQRPFYDKILEGHAPPGSACRSEGSRRWLARRPHVRALLIDEIAQGALEFRKHPGQVEQDSRLERWLGKEWLGHSSAAVAAAEAKQEAASRQDTMTVGYPLSENTMRWWLKSRLADGRFY